MSEEVLKELKELREVAKVKLIKIREEYAKAREILDAVERDYINIKNAYDKLDRQIANSESFKVIKKGHSGAKKNVKKTTVHPPDPVALFKSMTEEQKKEFLESLGVK